MKFLLLFVVSVHITAGANILGIWFHAGRSHHILGSALLKELARRGHNVTMASPFPLKEPLPNYTDIHLTGIQEDQDSRDAIFLKMNEGGTSGVLDSTIPLTRAQTEITLAHPEMRKLKESGVKFDVIIIDWFMNTAILYFGKLFQAPVIPMASHGTTFLTNDLTANPSPPSYIPFFMLPYPNDMSFTERLENSFWYFFANVLSPGGMKFHQGLIKKYFNDTLTIEEMKNLVAVIFSNSHYAYESPRPFVPNVIPIGGFHVMEPKKLPKRFQDFMDSSSDGVIFFSLGSNMKSVMLPEETRVAILKVFSKLPQRVIWKWEHEKMAGKPDNVMLSKWCPQNDILAHPNLKLFISHGGLLSTIEALHHGVPVLGIPVFGDQKANIPIAVRNGYALQLELKDLNEKSFSNAIQEMLTNTKYRVSAKKRSSLLRDQPISPMNAATFWVEHVIKHKGGGHLRNYGAELPWYKYHLIDVILFICFIFIAISVLLYILIRKVLQFLFNKIYSRNFKIKKH